MTTKHTPGPWWAWINNPPDSPSASVMGGGKTICLLTNPVADNSLGAELKANARLIAVAPELLETLRVIDKILSGEIYAGEPTIETIAARLARAEIKTAIAKAEGGPE